MQELFHSFLQPNLFIPHGHCYLWNPGLVGLHLISDLAIALAYYSIPITLLYFVRQRRDIPFYSLFLLFSAFIVSCGTTHLLEVWTLWHPIYWVSGTVKAITALVSLYSAFVLVFLIPQILALPSLAATNQKLAAEIAEREKTEIALRESEERFRGLFEQAAVGICLASLDGQFMRTNQKCCDIVGYSQSELLHLKFRDITHSEDIAIDLEQIQKLVTGEIQTLFREKRYIRKDGNVVQVNLTVSLLRDADGTPQQFISVIQDITDRKRAEAALQESEARFQAFMNNSPTASWITDENGRLIYISDTYKKVFQIPEGYVAGETDCQLYPPELARQYLQNIRKVSQTRQVVEEIELAPKRDGSIGQFLVYKFPLQSLSEQNLVGGVAIDITARIRAEQALQQLNQELEARVERRTAALQASEERFRNLVETSSDLVWEINEHGVYTYVSPKVFDILGYQPHEIIGKTPFDLMPKEEADRVAAEFNQLKNARQPLYCLENTNLHRSGNSVILETNGVPIFDRQGNFQGYRGIDRDITQRKQAEAELLAIANLQKAILDGIDYAIISTNPDGIIQTFNPAAEKMLGYKAAEIIGQAKPTLFHDSQECKQRAEALSLEVGKTIATSEEYGQVQNQLGRFEEEWTYIRKDGSRIPVLLSLKLILNSKGKPIGAVGIAKDITQQKQIEAQLRQNAAHLSLAQKIAHLGSWETDLHTQEIVWSEEVFRIFGREFASGPPSYAEFRQSIHPDDLDRHDILIVETIERGQPYEYEYRLLHPDGKLRYLLARAEAISGEDGKPIRLVGTVLDITDRKLAEEQLRNLSDRLTLALKSGAIGLWEWDTVRNLGIWDDRMYELYDLERTEPDRVCQLWLSRLHPDDRAAVETALGQALQGEKEYNIEFRVIHSDGTIRFLKGYALVQRNERGEPQSMVGINYDITERKQKEAQLRNLSDRLRLALQARAIAIWDWDLGGEVEWDDRMYELYGWSKADRVATYQDWVDAVHPDDRAAVEANFQNAASGEEKELYTVFRIVRTDGSIRYIKAAALLQRNEQGEPQRMVGINYDITERKLAEEALRESERRYAALTEAAPVGIFRFDRDGKNIYANARWCEITGRSLEPELEIKCLDLVHPEDRDRILMQWNQWLQTPDREELYRNEGRFLHLDGTIRWFYCQILRETSSSGIPIGYIGTLTDITDLKLAEAQLQESRTMLQLVLDTIPQRVFWKDRQFRYLGCNRAFARDGQVSIEQIIGKTDFELPWARWAHLYRADDTEVMNTGIPKLGYEEPAINPHEKKLWIRTNKVPLTNNAGEVIGILGSYEDITDRKQAEQKLEESRTMLQLVLDTIPQRVFWKNRQFRYFGCNQAFARDAGLSHPDRIIGKTDLDLICSSNADRYAVDDSRVMTTRTSKLSYEEIKELPDGSRRWLQTSKVPLTNSAGEVIGILGSYEDITERKQAEQALAKYTLEVEDLYDNAPCGYHSLDSEGRFVKINNTELQLLGYTREETIGKPLVDFFTEASRLTFGQNYPEFKERGWVKDLEFEMICKDGTILPVLISATAVKDDEGNYLYSRSTLFDLRDRKKIEEQLRQTNEQLMLANVELARATRLKDEFLANMSHELRTPLNVILGMSEGLQESVFGEMNERQRKSIATIERSGRHLLELINDILDLSKIEAGKLELELSDVYINNLCESSVVFVKHLALKKDIYLNTNIPENLGCIEADERRLRQALINLLSNAVKFTPEGGSVRLVVRLEQALETGELTEAVASSIPKFSSYLCLDIIDTGIGIAQADMEKLFQAFVQIDSSLSRRYSGTGLGLALVKRIANLHGGTVSVTSEVGRGSCFTIRIPYLVSKKSDRMQVDRDRGGDRSAIENPISNSNSALILLVEDNKPTSDTVSSYLRSRGYRLIVASNGQQAVNLVRIQSPNLILMDIQMPEMDGLEAIRQIRAGGKTDIPIIALTALAMPGDRERCLEAGADEYLTKPIQLKQLAQNIQQTLSKK